MKRNKLTKLVSWLLVLAVLLSLNVSTAPQVEAAENEEVNEANFDIVAENDEAILYYNRREALLRVESKATGIYYDTKAIEGTGGNNFTNNLRNSDMIFDYISNERTGLATTIDNYSMSISNNQYEHELIENGVRIEYFLGVEELTLQDLPKYVESQKFYEKVLSHLTESQREVVMEQYTLVGERYVRRNDSGVAQLKINRLYQYFYEVGTYTEEDLLADNEAYGVEIEDSAVTINAAIEYALDGKDLIVRVPVSEIVVGGGYPLARIRILPYLLSAKAGQDGYLVVPDGSGAVINFDNGRTTASNYSARIYGDDILRNVNAYKLDRYPVTLPMAAIKYEDHAILAIVEEGADLATITSEISGKADEFNKLNFSFNIMEIEQVPSVGSSNVTLPRASTDVYDGDIVMRYRLIDEGDYSDNEVDYVEIAAAYQDYLLSNEMLRQADIADEAPLFVELLGSIEKRSFFLGIPYNSNIALTTFEEMEAILADLQDRGVNEIVAEVLGFANNGMMHSSLKSIKPERVLGGKKGFNSLLANTTDGVALFPTVNTTQVYGNSKIKPRTEFARMLSGEYARIPVMNHILMQAEIKSSLSPYLLSPYSYESYIESFNKQAASYEWDNLSVMDLGNLLVTDYSSDRDTGRWAALELIDSALNRLDTNYEQLMLSNPNDYALQYADVVTDLPYDSNEHKSFDYEIPFVQLVLDGIMNYSSEAMNVMSYENPNYILLRAIEYKMSPKYQLTAADNATYTNTDFDGLLVTEYDSLADKITAEYSAYNDFYHLVKDSTVAEHTVESEFGRIVRYENGVTVLLNYSKQALNVGGQLLQPMSYEIIG